jgi:FkbM family methyltransferase
MHALHRARLLDSVAMAQVIWRYLRRMPHERDFRYFRKFPAAKGGLFLDVGANIGQTALSLSIFRPDLRIIAFEPNTALAKRLRLVRCIVGKRLTTRMTGLAERSGTQVAYLPKVRGVPFLQEVTLDRSVFLAPQTQQRFQGVVGKDFPDRFSIEEIQMRFEALDDLNLHPDVVKIDVQGCESLALAGMRATLKRCRPVLMIEADLPAEATRCAEFLADFGYRAFVYDTETDDLRAWDGVSTGINLFFVS